MNKYRAKKVKEDGITFDSKAEHKRYVQLKHMQKQGMIEGLIVHPRFNAIVNETKVCAIELDFQYYDKGKDMLVYEDVKGMWPPISKLKMKLLKAIYPDLNVFVLNANGSFKQ